ncbi:HPP family protein [Pararhodobacter sp. CCB-MM2]|uniref:HPP family protein n=1 Tax=Pararhodobacter sp. CCB-MM2 TaxID=1786003 RepID=UPI00082EF6D7|nr:HPP family protein [Pararhodobacter sp. CCB-MM2]
MSAFQALWQALRPAMPAAAPTEAIRAGLGAFVGLGVAALLIASPLVPTEAGLFLIAPFGATSVLLFAVPNSPLAQPFSAIAGNGLAALVGVAVYRLVPEAALHIPLAVGLAILLTLLCRAVHPPAGAVAMVAVMSPEAIDRLGVWFVLTPVMSVTVLLVAVAALYARLTGRHYPFRQLPARDEPAPDGLGLSSDELTSILERYQQSFNLGAADLARLVGAAERQAATHRPALDDLSAGAIMSRDLTTVEPQTDAAALADLFRRHGFTSIPVVEGEGRFLGVIFQRHLIGRAAEDAQRLGRGFLPALRRLIDPSREKPPVAADLMAVAGPRAQAQTPIPVLLTMMAEGATDAVPVLHGTRLIGIVTRTDLIAALARLALAGAPSEIPADPH